MSPHPSPSGGSPEGTPPSAPDLDEALRAIRSLAAAQHEVFGPLGQDGRGDFVFLARDLVRDRLVALKQNRIGRDPNSRAADLRVIDQLDSSVPPPADSCPVCQTPFASWDPACPECGADVAGAAGVPGLGTNRDQLLEAIRESAPGYEVLGEMPRAAGGGLVYFARDLAGGHLVALRLDQENAPGRGHGYTVAATRMMRPKLLYGTVGGDNPREVGPGLGGGHRPWMAVPSPPGPIRAPTPHTTPIGGASLAGADEGEKVCLQCGDVFGPEIRFCPKDGSALRPKARPENLVGQVIAERYHMLGNLGEGGMGMVYLAEHVRMGRRCAVKVMNPILLHDPDSVSRFNREAANASRINHPNVAAIYDFGETPDNIVYLAMELVEGESLAVTIERERALPERRAVDIGRQVAEALGAAHELGIVHRDLKPDNVMLARSRAGHDLVKVVDFGIAKVTQGTRQNVTRTGFVIGTPAYMSPEQILGENLDGRSDIYSLGCILYEMLTGERAFAGPSGEVSIHQRLTEPPPRPRRVRRDLSRKLDEIVTTAMARSPDQRFQSVGALRDALAATLSETPAQSKWRRWLPWGRSRATEALPEPTNTAAATPVPSPAGPPEVPLQLPGTAPVPLSWTEAVRPPPPSVGHGTTLLGHRSARPVRRNAAIVAGVGVGAVLVAFLLWMFVRPREDVLKETPPQALPEVASQGVPAAPVPLAETNKTSDSSPPAAVPRATVPPATVPPAAVPPADLPGEIRFAPSPPRGARLTVDGKAASLSPLSALAVLPGHHTIELRARGFQPATHEVEVAPGETTMVSLELLPAQRTTPSEPAPAQPPPPTPMSGALSIEGNLPRGAEIAVDGQPLSPATRAATIAVGTHSVRISAPGFRTDSFLVQVAGGSPTSWSAPELEALPKPRERPPLSAPAPAPAPAPSSTPIPASVPAPVDYASEVKQLLADYASAINARDIGRLKSLYPTMSADRENQWRDLFRDEVKDLKATLSVSSIQTASSSPEATFSLMLSFQPDRGKPQAYRIAIRAALARAAGRWRFVQLTERGD